MQNDIINKYGKEVIQNFWIFVEQLKFDSKTQDAATVRASILKKLSPTLAEKYKDIGDELAFSLYREVFYDKKTSYLYASFEAIAKGNDFYQKCWENPTEIEPLIEGINQFNNFSTVLPVEDDYFNLIMPTPQTVLDEFDEYDEYLESVGNKKDKKIKNKRDEFDRD
jgi:ribosomal protein S17E